MQEKFSFLYKKFFRAETNGWKEGILMQNFRTDLALEAHELWKRSADAETELQGVIAREERVGDVRLHRVEITSESGAKTLGKPVGRYVSLTLPRLPHRADSAFPETVELLAREFSALMPHGAGCILVAGLGNAVITPDAVGKETVEHVLVTRHLIDQVPEYFGSLRPVAAITPGVLGNTGVESREIIRSVAGEISPACILVVDALASFDPTHLCRTVQITDAGIAPGSGVGNSRAAITAESMGFPVIAVGVPTVTDGEEGLMITPKDIAARVADLGRMLGYAVSRTAQPALTLEELDPFLL